MKQTAWRTRLRFHAAGRFSPSPSGSPPPLGRNRPAGVGFLFMFPTTSLSPHTFPARGNTSLFPGINYSFILPADSVWRSFRYTSSGSRRTAPPRGTDGVTSHVKGSIICSTRLRTSFTRTDGLHRSTKQERGPTMLFTIAVILVVLWLLGIVTSTTMGGFIHILLVIAVIAVLVRIISGRKVI
jgi:Family of unknown function (DUF5670)